MSCWSTGPFFCRCGEKVKKMITKVKLLLHVRGPFEDAVNIWTTRRRDEPERI
jgi:hypothetical protein